MSYKSLAFLDFSFNKTTFFLIKFIQQKMKLVEYLQQIMNNIEVLRTLVLLSTFTIKKYQYSNSKLGTFTAYMQQAKPYIHIPIIVRHHLCNNNFINLGQVSNWCK